MTLVARGYDSQSVIFITEEAQRRKIWHVPMDAVALDATEEEVLALLATLPEPEDTFRMYTSPQGDGAGE